MAESIASTVVLEDGDSVVVRHFWKKCFLSNVASLRNENRKVGTVAEYGAQNNLQEPKNMADLDDIDAALIEYLATFEDCLEIRRGTLVDVCVQGKYHRATVSSFCSVLPAELERCPLGEDPVMAVMCSFDNSQQQRKLSAIPIHPCQVRPRCTRHLEPKPIPSTPTKLQLDKLKCLERCHGLSPRDFVTTVDGAVRQLQIVDLQLGYATDFNNHGFSFFKIDSIRPVEPNQFTTPARQENVSCTELCYKKNESCGVMEEQTKRNTLDCAAAPPPSERLPVYRGQDRKRKRHSSEPSATSVSKENRDRPRESGGAVGREMLQLAQAQERSHEQLRNWLANSFVTLETRIHRRFADEMDHKLLANQIMAEERNCKMILFLIERGLGTANSGVLLETVPPETTCAEPGFEALLVRRWPDRLGVECAFVGGVLELPETAVEDASEAAGVFPVTTASAMVYRRHFKVFCDVIVTVATGVDSSTRCILEHAPDPGSGETLTGIAVFQPQPIRGAIDEYVAQFKMELKPPAVIQHVIGAVRYTLGSYRLERLTTIANILRQTHSKAVSSHFGGM